MFRSIITSNFIIQLGHCCSSFLCCCSETLELFHGTVELLHPLTHLRSVLRHFSLIRHNRTVLSDIVQSAASRTTRSGLRSAESTDYITPRLNTKFGERSFSHAGPASWNSLPADLRAISDCSCFKSKLKTCFFFNQPSTFSSLLSFLFYQFYFMRSPTV